MDKITAIVVIGILVAVIPFTQAGSGDELDVIAPMEFNTETSVPSQNVTYGSGSIIELPEKPDPPSPIFRVIEKEGFWTEDNMMLFGLSGIFVFMFLLLYIRRDKKRVRILRRRLGDIRKSITKTRVEPI